MARYQETDIRMSNRPEPRGSSAYHHALRSSKAIHEGKAFTGKFLRPHAGYIKEIIDRLGCETVLDYGCGKGQQYEWVIPSTGQTIEDFWGVKVCKYDPAFPAFNQKPPQDARFDLVICTQVLGAIPTTDLPWVIDELYSYSMKAIYVSERLGPARKTVGDNKLRPTEWSIEQWCEALTRNTAKEVTFASRQIIEGQKITRHHRRVFNSFWNEVVWPEGIKAMNHKWTPEAAG
jgi:hypothetical protein